MGLVTRTYEYIPGALIIASQNTTNESTLYELVNGNLDGDNISGLAEAKITFDATGSGHKHTGSDSSLIDNTGAGYLLRCTTTGTDHAIIGRSSSSTAYAGLYGEGQAANALGGYFNHTNASGISLKVVNTASGYPCTMENQATGTAKSTLTIKNNSTAAGEAGIYMDTVHANGYGLRVSAVNGTPIRVTHTANTNAVEVTNSGTGSGVDVTNSGTGYGVNITNSSAGTGLRTTGSSGTLFEINATGTGLTSAVGNLNNNHGLLLRHGTATTRYALKTEVTNSCTPPSSSSGWVEFNGSKVNCTGGGYTVLIKGYSTTGGDCTRIEHNPNDINGTSASDDWVLEVINTSGGPTGNALFVDGYMNVTGTSRFVGAITKLGGGFLIDHPLHPKEKELYHSFVESPDMKNIYDGLVCLDHNGRACVKLPSYFTALNQDYRYQLTPIGSCCVLGVMSEINNLGQFVIDGPPHTKVSWQVTGIRKDRWAKKYRESGGATPERDKKTAGYHNPELWEDDSTTKPN